MPLGVVRMVSFSAFVGCRPTKTLPWTRQGDIPPGP